MMLNPPPAFLEYIRTSIEYMPKVSHFTDRDNCISKFLHELYFYEMRRSPQHPLFVENYQSREFLNTKMLKYYLDPYNKLDLYIEYKLNQSINERVFFIEKKAQSSQLTAQS